MTLSQVYRGLTYHLCKVSPVLRRWAVLVRKTNVLRGVYLLCSAQVLDSMLPLTKNGKSGPEKDETVEGEFENEIIDSLLCNEEVTRLGLDDLYLRIADLIQSLDGKSNGNFVGFPFGKISGQEESERDAILQCLGSALSAIRLKGMCRIAEDQGSISTPVR